MICAGLVFIAQFFVCRIVLANYVLAWMITTVAGNAPDEVGIENLPTLILAEPTSVDVLS